MSNTITVPTLAMRNGDFSQLLTANPYLKTIQLTDPRTGQPIPGNIIPQSLLSQNGLGLLRAYPEPTPGFILGNRNLFQSAPQPQNQRKDTVSIDFNPLLSHSFRFRFQNYNYDVVNPFTGNTDRAPRIFERPNQTVSLNYIYTIDPTTVNEFLVTASVDRVKIGVVTEGNRFDRTQYGINYPYLFPERKEIQNKIPTVDINGFQTLDGGPYPASSSGPIYNIANNTTKILGNHTLKVGFLYDRQGQNDFDQINVTGVPGGTNNQNGRFIFTDTRAGGSGLAIANTAMGLFTTYAEIGPRAYTPYRSQGFEWFLQDSWRVNSRLKLEMGLRHTMMTPYYYSLWRNMAVFDQNRYDPARAAVLDPKTGNVLSGDRYNGVVIPGSGWPEAAFGRVAIADSGEFDHLFDGGSKSWGEFQPWNFQPRVGLAYQINSKTVFRAGAGRFFARPGVADNIFLGGNPPFQPMVSLSNGSVDNPGGGARTNFPQFFMTSDPVFKIPSAWNWNFTVEREVGFSTKVEVAYVGRVGLHLERVRELNALQPGTLQQPANQGLNTNFLRPYKGFAFINLGENAGRSEYNSLQLSAERRFAKGLSFGVAYTLSESFDDTSQRRNALVNPFDASLNWGHSEFDTRHVAVVNFIYELPFFRNSDLSGRLLGGWQVTGVIQAQTGRPFWVGRDNDYAGIGVPGFQPWESNGPLESGIGGFSQGIGDDVFWFRTQVGGSPIFTQPAAGTFAYSQPRQYLYHPGIQSWNAALFKDFRITEQQTLQFRSEFFNFPNHPNLDTANSDPNSSVFGKVTAKTTDRRQIQLSLRYSF